MMTRPVWLLLSASILFGGCGSEPPKRAATKASDEQFMKEQLAKKEEAFLATMSPEERERHLALSPEERLKLVKASEETDDLSLFMMGYHKQKNAEDK